MISFFRWSLHRLAELDILPGIDLAPVDLNVVGQNFLSAGSVRPWPASAFTVDRTIGRP